MTCEMCGKPLPLVATIEVEGAVMRVCAGCVRFGRVIPEPTRPAAVQRGNIAAGLQARERRMAEKRVPLESEEDYVADYGERVRKAREGRRLSLDDVARAINEKVSLLSKVEGGSYHPDPTVTAKLERALGIKLREKVEKVAAPKHSASGGMTIGDLIKMKKD